MISISVIRKNSFDTGNSISKQEVIDLNESGKIQRNLNNPPLKDTVSVPDAGFTLIRFHANNPGYWLLHCHMSWHNHVGMAVILQVTPIDTIPYSENEVITILL